jgi:hypothetical protein
VTAEAVVSAYSSICTVNCRILSWLRNGEINEEEFVELYKSFLDAIGVRDLFSSKQKVGFPKEVVIGEKIVQDRFMSPDEVTLWQRR